MYAEELTALMVGYNACERMEEAHIVKNVHAIHVLKADAERLKMKINIENKPCFYDNGEPLTINGKPYKHPKATIWVESIRAFVCSHCKREADL